MTALIIEDEAPAQRIIQRFVEDTPNLELIGVDNNALTGRRLLEELQPDLLFLDINLPKLTGIELLRMLKHPPLVILTTAYSEYALESYDFSVVDYLLKPFSFARFLEAVDKARERLMAPSTIIANQESVPDHFFVRIDKIVHRVALKDLIYFKAEGDFVRIVLAKQQLLVSQSLAHFAEQLVTSGVIQVHRSYLLYLPAFSKLEGNIIHTTRGEISLSRSYRDSFLQHLQ